MVKSSSSVMRMAFRMGGGEMNVTAGAPCSCQTSRILKKKRMSARHAGSSDSGESSSTSIFPVGILLKASRKTASSSSFPICGGRFWMMTRLNGTPPVVSVWT